MQATDLPFQYAGGLNPLPKGKVPSTMRYETKQPAVACQFNRVQVQPDAGSVFGPGDTLAFQLPVQPGTYLANKMSYISFKLTVGGATVAARLAYGGVSVFEKMQIFHAGNMIEQISGNYNDLNAIMMTLKCQDDNMNNIQKTLNGTGLARTVTHYSTFTPEDPGNDPLEPGICMDNPDIQVLTNDLFDQAGVAGERPPYAIRSRYFVMQPFSGLLGADVDKFCPLGFLSRGRELRVEFQLATALKALYGDHTDSVLDSYTISDVKYNCFIITLDPAADSLIRANLGETCVISSKTYLVANSTVHANSSGLSVPLPFAASSVCAIYFAMVPSTAKSAADEIAIGSYPKNNLGSYDISIGGFRYPNAPIYCATGDNQEALGFAELLNSVSGLASTNLGLGIPFANYFSDTTAVPGAVQVPARVALAPEYRDQSVARPLFIGGINTEAFHPYSDSIISGMDTLSRQMQLNLQFSGASEAADHDLMIFALIDTAFYIDMINGVMRSSV